MKGFEIIINEEKRICAASNRTTCIFLHPTSILVLGVDSTEFHNVWQRRCLKIGDTIKVRVTKINNVSQVIERYPSDRTELKKRYYELKKELEELGYI